MLLLILCNALIHGIPSQAGEWTYTRVVDGMVLGQIGPESMRMKNSTTPAIAFGGDKIYYSTYDTTAGSWSNTVVVEENPDTSPPALAFNPSGTLGLATIAYYDKKARVLKVARQVMTSSIGLTWSIETIGPSSGNYDSPSLTVDSSGYPHVAYTDQNGNLVYAYKDASGWHFDHAIVIENDYPGKPSLALNSSRQPFIAYTDMIYHEWTLPDGAVKIASRNCSPGTTPCTWSVESVGAVTAYDSPFAHLIIDPSDRPHVFFMYTGAELTVIRRATKISGSWSTEHFDSFLRTPNSSFSVAQDSLGDFHFIWQDNNGDRLLYQKSTGAWSTIIGNQEKPTTAAMVLTGGSVPFVAFTSSRTSGVIHRLHSAKPSASGWVVDNPWSGSFFSQHHLVIDSQGHPHIAYYDYYRQEMRWAEFNGTSWADRLVKSNLNPGYMAFSLGPSDRPNIAYTDSDEDYTVKLLRYGCINQICMWPINADTVDAASSSEINLAIDSTNRPHVAYNRSADGIVYAYRDDTSWIHNAPISDTKYSSHSLTLSPADRPQIAYSRTNGDLYVRVQNCFNNICSWHTLGPINNTVRDGFSIVLRSDSSSKPHVFADKFSSTINGIEYFRQDDGGWTSRIMYQKNPDYIDSFWQNYDFDLAPGDQPHFVVSGRSSDTVYPLLHTTEYRHNNIRYWQTTTIRNFEYHIKPRLKVDKWGQLHIVYVDKGNDLIHAVKVEHGYLIIHIDPPEAADAGAQWRIQGTTTWHDSGATVADIPVGIYTIEFKEVTGWKPDGTITVTVEAGKTTIKTVSYIKLASVLPGVLMLLLDDEE
jgi:hypothetical protein